MGDATKKVWFRHFSHVREFSAPTPLADANIISEYLALTHLENRPPSRKNKGVVHTEAHNIEEVRQLHDGNPVTLDSLISRKKQLLRKLEHVYTNCSEDFKTVLRNSIVDYETKIRAAADPAILVYLNGQIRTFSLGDAEQGFDALAFRIDTIYCKMEESLQRIAQEALDAYTDRIGEVETDWLAEPSSEEEDNDISGDPT